MSPKSSGAGFRRARRPRAFNAARAVKRIPRKFSDAILAACRDLTAVERLKSYSVNMSVWHRPPEVTLGGKCEVCFAGALMARTCELPLNKGDTSLFQTSSASAFIALNSIRRGELGLALRQWPVRTAKEKAARDQAKFDLPAFVPVTAYTPETSKAFKADMRRIARTLARRGL